MTNKKNARNALFMSVISLMLCVSMLVGTTFAWFTDSVTSANNIIKSGNLDIELEYWNGTAWVDVSGKSDILTNTLWEPGVTEIAYLRVANAGSLALKYQLGINIVSETAGVNQAGNSFNLSDYIQFGVVEGVDGETAAFASREAAVAALSGAKKLNEGYTKASSMNAGQADLYLALVVYMPTTVGNEANHDGTNIPEINLGINVFATQLEAESDSFGPDYDNGAYFPVAPEAIPEEGEDLLLNGSAESGITVKVPAAVVAGLDEDVTSLSVQASAPVVDTTNKTVSFSTVELVDQDGNEVDIAAAGGKVTVTLPVKGAFDDGEKVDVYHDGSFVTSANVVDGYISYETSHFCEVSVKAAEEVELNNTIDSVKEFIAFANAVNAGNSYAGKTVTLGADLDLAGVTWTPIGTSSNPFIGTFDGNGKVIKNLSVLMPGKSDVGLFGFTTEGEIKNVTVENAKVAGRLNVGVVAGTPYTSKYNNITVKGHVEVDGMAYVGGVGGKNAYADWNNITVSVDAKSYVNANSVENGTAYRTYVGGVVGFNGEGGHSFTNITSNINVIGSTCDIGGAFGIAHYGNKFENVTVTGTVTGGEGADEIGGIAGVWHNQDGYTVTFTNCKYDGNLSIVGAAYNTTGNGTLIIDGKSYVAVNTADELADALAAGGGVILVENIDMGATTLTVAKDVTLDLNGKVLSGTCNAGQGHLIMVNNGAALNVKDSSTNQSGKITYAQGTSNTGWAIDLEGKMNLYSGTIELTGDSWSIGYCVDVRPNAWGTNYTEDTVFHMYGGKVISSDGAIRVASSSSDSYGNIVASFIMDGGEIDAAWDGIFVQQSNAAYDTLNVTINGGTVTSALSPIRVYGPSATSVNADTAKPMTITINGGNLVMNGTPDENRTWHTPGKIVIGGDMTLEDLNAYATITIA